MPDPRKSVFINCPYDPAYEPLFNALVLTIVYCGFIPRSATETGDVATSRMERILNALSTSAYSVHDLSRCQGEGEQMLARFNMPLELGIAIARRHSTDQGNRHDWLVLVPEDAPYTRFVSDLAGFDIPSYQGTPESLVKRVMFWLYNRQEALPNLTPTPVIQKLDAFNRRKAELKAEWSAIPWPMLVKAAAECAQEAK